MPGQRIEQYNNFSLNYHTHAMLFNVKPICEKKTLNPDICTVMCGTKISQLKNVTCGTFLVVLQMFPGNELMNIRIFIYLP